MAPAYGKGVKRDKYIRIKWWEINNMIIEKSTTNKIAIAKRTNKIYHCSRNTLRKVISKISLYWTEKISKLNISHFWQNCWLKLPRGWQKIFLENANESNQDERDAEIFSDDNSCAVKEWQPFVDEDSLSENEVYKKEQKRDERKREATEYKEEKSSASNSKRSKTTMEIM